MCCCLLSLRPAAIHPPSPPPISVGFVRCFIGTMQPSDSSSVSRQLRLLDLLSRPGIAQATAGQTRSPRFQRDPSIRPRQLRLAHRYAFTVKDSHPLLLAGLPAHIGFVLPKLAQSP